MLQQQRIISPTSFFNNRIIAISTFHLRRRQNCRCQNYIQVFFEETVLCELTSTNTSSICRFNRGKTENESPKAHRFYDVPK